MRLVYLLAVLLVACFTLPLFSQETPPPMVFGKIPPVHLEMRQFEADTNATAVVLCNYGQANIENPPGSFRLRWEHQKRIKILKKEGFDYTNISIPFYSYNKTEEFFFDKAAVYLPDGQVIKLTKKDVFVEKQNDKVSVAKLVFPKIEEGCIIEYAYFINSQTIHELREWYFQEDIPVLWSEIRADFPKFLDYIFLFQGNDNMEKVEDKDGVVRYESDHGSFIFSPKRYVMKNAPALKEEGFITTMSDYLARIRFQLSEVRYPDGRVEKVLTNWKGLQDEIEHSSAFGEQFLKKSNYKKMVDEVLPLASQLSSNMEKVKFFYDYLNDNMAWTGNFSAFTRQKKLDEIFESKKANSGELNLMLFVLLREAGITAFPVLTSTRSHGRIYEQYPILDQFDHILVLAVVDGTRLLLDVSDPLRPMGYPSIQALNGRGLMLKIGSGDPSWMDITASKDAIDVLACEMALDGEGNMKGIIVGVHKGYSAMPERRYFSKDSTGSHWKERLLERFPYTTIESARSANIDALDKTFLDTVVVSIPSAAQVSGDFMYLPPIIWTSFNENVFKMKERNYPVDIPYPFQEQLVLKLTMPEGYVVESLPENLNNSLPANGGNFFFATSTNNNQVQVSARLNISKLRFTPAEYAALKELFGQVVSKYGEQIVLKRL